MGKYRAGSKGFRNPKETLARERSDEAGREKGRKVRQKQREDRVTDRGARGVDVEDGVSQLVSSVQLAAVGREMRQAVVQVQEHASAARVNGRRGGERGAAKISSMILTAAIADEFSLETEPDAFMREDGSPIKSAGALAPGYIEGLLRQNDTITTVHRNSVCAAFVTRPVNINRRNRYNHTVDIVCKHGHRGERHGTRVFLAALKDIMPEVHDIANGTVPIGTIFAEGKVVNPVVNALVKRCCKILGFECQFAVATSQEDVGHYMICYAQLVKDDEPILSRVEQQAARAHER